MIQLHCITPVTHSDLRSRAEFGDTLGSGVTFTSEILKTGPANIECEADEIAAEPEVVKRAIAAEARGVDAIIVDCFGDPGVRAARAATRLPIVGPGESALHFASMLGRPFAVVTILDAVYGMIENMARHQGVWDQMTPLGAVNLPVAVLESDYPATELALINESIAAVAKDGAQAIILGCTGMAACAQAVSKALGEEFGKPVPVIEPLTTAASVALSLARMRLSHSRRD